MDFGTLLQTAKENEQTNKKEPVRVYSTKFTPPKKQEKKAKNLSSNIQKFLARKEAEEKQKLIEANKKRDELLALRSKDRKATRRVNVMLKRTKSANQSVIDDAIDRDNTAVTLAGPSQPDEDDYGYVSQEAAAFYNKMMEKYNKMPDDPKFPESRKKASSNLSSTKDRVKAALEKEKEEALLPHKRKRKSKEEIISELCDEEPEIEEPTPPPPQPKVKPKPSAPPPMNFSDLLKLAAQKQHEPIMIEVKPKEEEGPLLTKKQKLELEKEQQRREAKNQNKISLEKSSVLSKSNPSNKSDTNSKRPFVDERISKTGIQDQKYNPSKPKISLPSSQNFKESKILNGLRPSPSKISKLDTSDKLITKVKAVYEPTKKKHEINKKVEENSLVTQSTSKAHLNVQSQISRDLNRPKSINEQRKILSNNRKPLNNIKPKQFPPNNLKPKQFPPPDIPRKEFPAQGVKRKPLLNKRRIIDDEYDSEMDDFIDDGPEENEDYSKYIKDIFGYDKNKYRGIDEDDIDNMESTFAQQMREDVRSTKLGIMEDLEDIKREKEEKKRKAIMKKKSQS